MKAKRINLWRMGVRSGTEIVSIVVDDGRLSVAIDYGNATSIEMRALLVTSLFRDIVADIARLNPGQEKEIFEDVRRLVDSGLDSQQKKLGLPAEGARRASGVFMAGGWAYCDCNDLVLQELDEDRAPRHAGDTNRCPSCGMIWVGKDAPGGVVLVGGGTPSLCWWRPDRDAN